MVVTISSGVRRWIGVALLVAAVALAVVGVVVAVGSPVQTASAPPATVDVPPSTVAPRVTTTSSTTTTVPVTTTTVPVATTTLPLSPLNSLVGEVASAHPAPPRQTVPPVAMTFEAIGLDGFRVREIGVAPDGQLEVPDETEIGWYRLGAGPGQPGATVLAAHVSWRGEDGPFLRLAGVEPGAEVRVDLADGTTRTYQVIERAQYGKLMLPRERIWTRQGPETLVLITCGGAFNPDIRRYADNIVLYAVPIA